MAIIVLSIAILGIAYTTTAGHRHLQFSDERLRAIRLAEQLMEEIQSRPYSGSGADRSSFSVDGYNGFHESAGALKDFAGVLYGPADQNYNRSVDVFVDSKTVVGWEASVIPGKTVVITIQDLNGAEWHLSRFIAEPISP